MKETIVQHEKACECRNIKFLQHSFPVLALQFSVQWPQAPLSNPQSYFFSLHRKSAVHLNQSIWQATVASHHILSGEEGEGQAGAQMLQSVWLVFPTFSFLNQVMALLTVQLSFLWRTPIPMSLPGFSWIRCVATTFPFVVILSSPSHLGKVRTAAMLEDILRASDWMQAAYGRGMRVVHGFPLVARGLTDKLWWWGWGSLSSGYLRLCSLSQTSNPSLAPTWKEAPHALLDTVSNYLPQCTCQAVLSSSVWGGRICQGLYPHWRRRTSSPSWTSCWPS